MPDIREERIVRISPDSDCFVYGDITRLTVNGTEFDVASAEMTIDEDNIVRKRYKVFPVDVGPGAGSVDVRAEWQE
jgi:hypothetical protein